MYQLSRRSMKNMPIYKVFFFLCNNKLHKKFASTLIVCQRWHHSEKTKPGITFDLDVILTCKIVYFYLFIHFFFMFHIFWRCFSWKTKIICFFWKIVYTALKSNDIHVEKCVSHPFKTLVHLKILKGCVHYIFTCFFSRDFPHFPWDTEILCWCPAGSLLLHGEKVPL